MTFEVYPPALLAAGRQVGTLGSTLPAAHAYVGATMQLGAGRHVYSQVKEKVERTRAELLAAYADGADFEQFLVQAGRALVATGHDYAGIDQATRAVFDAKLPTTRGGGTRDLDDGSGYDGHQETAGVDAAEVTALLQPPGTGFEGYETWRAIQTGATYVLSLDWVFDLVAKIGRAAGADLPDLGDKVRDTFEGDWESVGRCAGALLVLGRYLAKVEHEAAASVIELDRTWSGNAADAAFASFQQFQDALEHHRSSLTQAYAVLDNYALGMRYLTDGLGDVVGALADLLGVFNFGDLLQRGATAEIKAFIVELTLWVDLVVVCIDACFALVAVFCLTLGQLGRDESVAIPDGSISRYQRPDVDGPG